MTPRMELVSGRALNIAPPGWEGSYSKLRDALNLSHGWARPNDPARARDLGLINTLPADWSAAYEQSNYVFYDPIVHWLFDNEGSIRWSEIDGPDTR